VIQFWAHGPQAHLDVPQTFAVRQLRESQAKELIQAGKVADTSVAAVTFHTFVEGFQGQVVHQLGENGASWVHLAAFRAWKVA
jgi:hypothetical protein